MTQSPSHVAFVCDLRSPIARGWISNAQKAGVRVSVVSSRMVAVEDFDYQVRVLPLGPEALAEALRRRVRGAQETGKVAAGTSPPLGAGMRMRTKDLLRRVAPYITHAQGPRLGRTLSALNPDVVHALRIPYEGMTAACAGLGVPLAISVWGNDFTLHAQRGRANGRATRRAMRGAIALHTDCRRDLRLAVEWGFDAAGPSLVAPGSGGIDRELFKRTGPNMREALDIPSAAFVVLNPRGVREYVHIPEFVESARRLVKARSDIHLICTGMQGHPVVERFAADLGSARSRLHLLPSLTHRDMPALFRTADVSLSLTTHDGTPNTLLESMSAGCFPIVGEVESVHEWINDRENGRIVSPLDPAEITRAVLEALDDPGGRRAASDLNAALIAARADRGNLRTALLQFYDELASHDVQNR